LKIDGAIAVVTGGARGLGLAIASHLQLKGAFVVVADRDEAALEKLCGSLMTQVVDVTEPEAVKAAVATIVRHYGRIDVLVNNAGVIYSAPFVDISNPSGMMHDYGLFRESLKVNLDSVFIMTSATVEQMVMRRTKGVIVNISSICACGNEGQTAYSAAKAAVNALTITWSKELGRWGIRCNAVAPGFIGTESTSQALDKSVVQHIKDNTPLKRLGSAEEVAQAVASIVENDFINGMVLKVDGGLRL